MDKLLAWADGQKTYLAAFLAILLSLAALAGIDAPVVTKEAAPQILIDAILAALLRRGIKTGA